LAQWPSSGAAVDAALVVVAECLREDGEIEPDVQMERDRIGGGRHRREALVCVGRKPTTHVRHQVVTAPLQVPPQLRMLLWIGPRRPRLVPVLR
jgi:hypothetical protein